MYRPSGEIAAPEALPLDVIGVALTLAKGGGLFDRHHKKTANDKPIKPTRAMTANIAARLRTLRSASELLLNAVRDSRRLSVDCAPGSIAVCISNEDDSPVIGCVTIGDAPLAEAGTD